MTTTKGPWERREPTDVPAEPTDLDGYWWAEGYDAALTACRPEYDAVVAERDSLRIAVQEAETLADLLTNAECVDESHAYLVADAAELAAVLGAILEQQNVGMSLTTGYLLDRAWAAVNAHAALVAEEPRS